MAQGHQFRAVFNRELSAYFNSAIAYIFIIVFVMLSGGLFMTNFFLLGTADMRAFFDLLPLILCVFIPALTMRLWAEDRKGNTFELLLTFPMPSWKLVLGKFFAAFSFYILALAGTLFIPVMVLSMGKPDLGPIIGGDIGGILLGAFFISIGLFISGLCVDQIAAFIIAMMVAFFFFLIGWEAVASTIDGWVSGAGSFLSMALSASGRFSSFSKGVLDLRDLTYFLIMIVMFLVLNALSIEDRLRRSAKLYFTMTAVIGGIIILCANILLADLPLGRFDLTTGRLYTITEATARILKKLDAPVTLKLYITPQEKMPTALKTLEQDIRDRLEELRVKSAGKLQYKTIRMEAEPLADKPDENSTAAKLYKKGIAPISVRSIDKDEVGVKLVYAAIAVAYKDRDEEYIPRVLPADVQKLEYSVASKIYRMMAEKKQVVALVAPYEEKAMDPGMLNMLKKFGQAAPLTMRDDLYRGVEAALQYEGHTVKRIRLTEDEPIPEGIDALVVLVPDKMTARQRYEVARYLYKGGKVVMATQSYKFDYKQNQYGTGIFPQRIANEANDLLGAYGVNVDDRMLMDENNDVINVSGNAGIGPMSFTAPVKAPIQIRVPEEQLNQDVSITGGLPSIFYLWGSLLDLDKEKMKALGLKNTVLISSSHTSWAVPQRSSMLTRDDISSVGRKFEGPYPLAVMVEGQFPDTTAGKSVPAWKEEPSDMPEAGKAANAAVVAEALKKEDAKPGKLIVAGCVKMFEESLLPDNGSLGFLTNAVDVLTLGGELINIRNHRVSASRIKPLDASAKFWWRLAVVFCVPVGIAVFGIIRVLWRRKEKALYMQAVKK